MTEPEYKQFFENFRGLDLTSSPIGRGIDFARSFKNVERLHNGSIRSREGLQLASQNLQVVAIFPYTYVDDSDVTQQELIGIAAFENVFFKKHYTLVALKTNYLNITYSGSNLFAFQIYKSVSGIVFELFGNFTSVLTVNLGTGYESSDKTLQALADDISGVADFSATVDNTAVVNGAQSGVTTITVDSGHTLAIGDFIYFEDTQSGNAQDRVCEVINTDATTVTIPNDSVYGDVNVTDNLVMGLGAYKAGILEIINSQGYSTTAGVSFTHWQPVHTLLDGTFLGLIPRESHVPRAELKFGFPDFTNHRNNVYFGASYFLNVSTKTSITALGDIDYNAGVWKYDGKSFYLSGLFFSVGNNAFSLTNSGSGSTPATGNYTYGVSFKRTDAQGNEIEFFHNFEKAHNVSSGNSVHLRFLDVFADTYRKELNFKDAKLTSAASSVNTISITSGHKFRVDDYVYLADTNLGTVRRKVTSITLTTITVDGSALIINNTERVSNFMLRIWRTKDASSIFSLCKEFPYFANVSENYTDTIADANLGILQTAIKPVNIQYPFPKSNCVETHQDLLCSAIANTVYWEDADSPESSPRAVSNASLPYGITEDIKALVSNIDASLFVIKPTAQFELVGNMASNEIEINKVSENSIGVKSNKSAIILNRSLVGANVNGLWSSVSGQQNTGFAFQILKLFKRSIFKAGNIEYRLNFTKIVISYDKKKNWIHVYLPFEKSSGFALVNGYYTPGILYSKHFVLMLSDIPDKPDCWAEFSYIGEQQGNAGFADIGNTFYQQSSVAETDCTFSDIAGNSDITGYLHKRADTGISEDFLDNTSAYTSEIITAWDDGADPSSYKFFLDFVLYQLQPDYFVTDFLIDFESYRDWDDTKIDTQRSSSLSFTTSNVKEKTLQFDKAYKAQRRSFKLSTTVSKTPMLLSGYQYTVKEDTYNKGRIIK